jgi:hypothetical protein
LAEVQSHVAETGEDPRSAFGSPREYAAEIAGALGLPRRGLRAVLRSVDAADLALAVACGLCSFLLADGVWSLGAGKPSVLGLPAWVVALFGAAMVGVSVVRTAAHARQRSDDAVIDPRTGADMVPFGRWRTALPAAVPVVMLALVFVGGLLTR